MPEQGESEPLPAGLAAAEQSDRASQGTEVREHPPTAEQVLADGQSGPKTNFERNLGIANTIVQMVAILVGGAFAIVKFGLVDAPPLHKTLRVAGSLHWSGASHGRCLANMDINITNISKSTIEVGQIRRRAWLVANVSENTNSIVPFDPEDLAKTNDPLDDRRYPNPPLVPTGPLVQSYAPGQSLHNDFYWFVEPKKDTYALFKIEACEHPGDKMALDYQFQWSPVCDGKVAEH